MRRDSTQRFDFGSWLSYHGTGAARVSHDDPENSKRALWRVKSEFFGGRRKKKREILAHTLLCPSTLLRCYHLALNC